jgi:hypothetical protein
VTSDPFHLHHGRSRGRRAWPRRSQTSRSSPKRLLRLHVSPQIRWFTIRFQRSIIVISVLFFCKEEPPW